MPKQKKSALIKFLASVLAVVIGTAVLGTMTGGAGAGPEGMEGGFRHGQTATPPAGN